MARISSIRIKRFKRLVDIELDLGPSTVLIGANNAGKSSVLQAIQFAVSLAQSAKLVGGISWARDKYELSFSQTQLLYCPVSDAMTLGPGAKLVEDASQQIEVRLSTDGGDSTLVSLRKGRNRNLKVAIEGEALGATLQDLSSPFSIYAPGLAGIPRTEAFMSEGMVRRTVARGDANLVLRNVLYLLRRDESKWRVFMEDMSRLFPALTLDVRFVQDQDEHITAECSLDGGPTVPLDAAGTSVLQASQILGYVTLFRPRLLILDEPDSHLHPDRQRQLCRLISECAESRGFQCLMSTHSRHVLDAVRRKSTVFWLSRGSVVKDTDIDTTKLLLDLGALDSVDYLADGHGRCIVATEDEHKEYIKTLLDAACFPEDETIVVSYPGCSQIEAARVLGRFLSDKASHVKLVIHRDRDYLQEATVASYEQELEEMGIESFVTPGSDIEGCFISADHLAELNPPIAVSRMRELIEQATNETRDDSIKAIVNHRTEQAFRARKKGGSPPNHGDIAVAAQREYEAAPDQMRRGDVVLGRLKAHIQREKGSNPVVTAVTPAIVMDKLSAIKARVWPE